MATHPIYRQQARPVIIPNAGTTGVVQGSTGPLPVGPTYNPNVVQGSTGPIPIGTGYAQGMGDATRVGGTTVGTQGIVGGQAAGRASTGSLGALPPELAWMNNPAVTALVKRLSDAGQAS